MFALSNKNKFYWFLFDQQARHKIVHIFEAFISRSARNSCTTVDAALAKNTDYLYCLNHQRTHHMIPLTPIGTFRIAFCITSISRVPIKRLHRDLSNNLSRCQDPGQLSSSSPGKQRCPQKPVLLTCCLSQPANCNCAW